MTVIKKSGKKEEFSPDKLSRSISAACRDAKVELSDQQLKELVGEFQQIVSGKNMMTTRQIDIVINGLLYSKGYYGPLEQYASYKSE